MKKIFLWLILSIVIFAIKVFLVLFILDTTDVIEINGTLGKIFDFGKSCYKRVSLPF